MYAISKDHRGKGYTTQAVSGLINYLFEHAGIETLNAIVLPYNIGSIKVIQRCGFVHCGQIAKESQVFEHYMLSRPNC